MKRIVELEQLVHGAEGEALKIVEWERPSAS
jgi:hypothetical protein